MAASAVLCVTGTAAAQGGFKPEVVENRGYFQCNEIGSAQWKLRLRSPVADCFATGRTFTQCVDLSLVQRNKTGTSDLDGAWSLGVGSVFIEETVESREVGDNLRPKARCAALHGESPVGRPVLGRGH